MRFESPLALLLLLLIPFVLESTRRKKKGKLISDTYSLPFSSGIDLSKLKTSWRTKARTPILSFLKIIAFSALVLALARPQTGSVFTEIEGLGHDIVIALDLSGSMQAMDFTLEGQTVDRLSALKSVVNQFIMDRKGDRMALVVFGDQAFTQCPLTRDNFLLAEFVNALQIGIAGHATAIGDALGIAIKRIQDIEADSKVIVLVTDGKNNSGSLNPIETAKLAEQKGIRVHTIGIGGPGTAPFPARGIFGETRLINRPVEYDERTLQDIARITGGTYFNAKNTEKLAEVYKQINKLEERNEKEFEHIEYKEQFLPFILVGLVSFVLYSSLALTVFLRIP